MDYLEFIARVTSPIPDKGQVMVRYYGLYANAHRGKVKLRFIAEKSPPPHVSAEIVLMEAEESREYFLFLVRI